MRDLKKDLAKKTDLVDMTFPFMIGSFRPTPASRYYPRSILKKIADDGKAMILENKLFVTDGQVDHLGGVIDIRDIIGLVRNFSYAGTIKNGKIKVSLKPSVYKAIKKLTKEERQRIGGSFAIVGSESTLFGKNDVPAGTETIVSDYERLIGMRLIDITTNMSIQFIHDDPSEATVFFQPSSDNTSGE